MPIVVITVGIFNMSIYLLVSEKAFTLEGKKGFLTLKPNTIIH